MKLTRIIAAATAPAALAAILLGTAGQASAATTHAVLTPSVKPTGSITCGSTDPGPYGLGSTVISGLIDGNLIVPAGMYCKVDGGEVTGNVNVQGKLSASGVMFDKNVNVSGQGSGLQFFNNPSHIKGNLTITSSSGAPNNNYYGTGTSFFTNADQGGAPQVDGNFTFTGNTGDLSVGYSMTVAGNFTASGDGPYAQSWEFDHSGLNVLGQQSIS